MTTIFSHNQQPLLIRVAGSERAFPIASFDGIEGYFHASDSTEKFESGNLHEAVIEPGDSGSPLWSGTILIDASDASGITFQLCVKAKLGSAQERIIQWRQVPSVLTVFDSGYDALLQEEVEAILDDLVTFHGSVKAKVHFEVDTASLSIRGAFTDQESLKDLSEVLVTWKHAGPYPVPTQVAVLELELFEMTYFIIGIVADADGEGLILGLTSHFYCQARRVGRRIPVDRVRVGEFELVEVSDFGLKAEVPTPKAPSLGSSLQLNLPDSGTVMFTVIYCKPLGHAFQCGLLLAGDSPDQRKAWQNFILRFQYELLSTRTAQDHEACWALLGESGYLSGTVGEMVKASRDSVLKEWQHVDQIGPDKGVSVLGSHGHKCVATIGITRASDTVWVAQAAAVLDDPQYLEFTKSMYGWRTRAILQQPDGMYHLAFFAANKPFLDRFFRKFYLALTPEEKHLVSWDEWQPSFLRLESAAPSSMVESLSDGKLAALANYKVFDILDGNSKSDLKLKTLSGALVIQARPHQHLAQFLASVWSPVGAAPSLNDIAASYRELGHPFAVLMTEQRGLKDVYGEAVRTGLLIEGEDEVVWTCHRSLLPRFLANSLKALELMVRKYGMKQVA